MKVKLTKKQLKSISNKKYREANKEALRLKREDKKESVREYNSNYYKNNKTKFYDDRINCYVVYEHCTGGLRYIGEGTNLRPKQTYGRSQSWHKAFSNGYEVNIIARFETKGEAQRYEAELIRQTGIHNLVNTNISKI
tara:strand:+ start:335 stop:748 length:414 start_codon:yes stop_codon:yes gene_type:complete